MARIEGRPTINAEIVIVLTEEEAGSLDAMVGYGVDAFVRAFYDKLGKAYMEKYEKGLRSLFESIRSGGANMSGFISKVKEAREYLNGTRRELNTPRVISNVKKAEESET